MQGLATVFICNELLDTTLSMWTCIILVEGNMVLFAMSFGLDCSVEAVKVSQINVAVLVRNSQLLTIIIVIPLITNAF